MCPTILTTERIFLSQTTFSKLRQVTVYNLTSFSVSSPVSINSAKVFGTQPLPSSLSRNKHQQHCTDNKSSLSIGSFFAIVLKDDRICLSDLSSLFFFFFFVVLPIDSSGEALVYMWLEFSPWCSQNEQFSVQKVKVFFTKRETFCFTTLKYVFIKGLYFGSLSK